MREALSLILIFHSSKEDFLVQKKKTKNTNQSRNKVFLNQKMHRKMQNLYSRINKLYLITLKLLIDQ